MSNVKYFSLEKAERLNDAKHAKPSDSIAELHESIASGEIKPTKMIILYEHEDKKISYQLAGVSDTITILGMIEFLKTRLDY